VNTLEQTYDFWASNGEENLRLLPAILVHLELMGATLGLAIAIGVLLGLVAARTGGVLAFVVMQLANLGRIVPSFALILLMIPLVGLGFVPPLIALVALGVPPILVNTYVGVRGVDPAAVEAARGMGLTGLQLLRRVELPLAVPLVLAGIGTSAVQVVATATLSQPVGAGGLGEIVFNGLATFRNDVILAGVIPIAALALAVEALFTLLRRLVTPRGLRVAQTP
jgi:osmoprotectant transport system permease protein